MNYNKKIIKRSERDFIRDFHTQGGYSGFQVTGMIELSQKSRPKKIPRTSSKTQKNPWTKN